MKGTQPTSRTTLVGMNLLAVLAAAPSTFVGILIAGFASDPGPNLIGDVLQIIAYSIVPIVLVLSAISQAKKSFAWALAALAVPVVPMLLPFLLLILALPVSIVYSLYLSLGQ